MVATTRSVAGSIRYTLPSPRPAVTQTLPSPTATGSGPRCPGLGSSPRPDRSPDRAGSGPRNQTPTGRRGLPPGQLRLTGYESVRQDETNSSGSRRRSEESHRSDSRGSHAARSRAEAGSRPRLQRPQSVLTVAPESTWIIGSGPPPRGLFPRTGLEACGSTTALKPPGRVFRCHGAVVPDSEGQQDEDSKASRAAKRGLVLVARRSHSAGREGGDQ